MKTTTLVGKTRRLSRIFSCQSGKAVLVPLDDSLLSGPINGLESIRDKVHLVSLSAPDVIMGFVGLIKNFSDDLSHLPFVLNITASTTRSIHTRKTIVGSVEQAVQLGVEAVAVHVNVGSQFETEMLKILGAVSRECENLGMPLLGIMYPRSEGEHGDNNFLELKKSDPQKYSEFVAHAARVGLDLGVDFIKTQYTGSPETFRFVVEAVNPIPVIVAGGPALPPNEMFQMAYEVMLAGGAGISFGRNVFSRKDPRPYVYALKEIVHKGARPQEVINCISENFQIPSLAK